MTVFEYLAAVFALIVGLGVTRLLGSAVEVFRRRRESRLSVTPLAWAGLIFVRGILVPGAFRQEQGR